MIGRDREDELLPEQRLGVQGLVVDRQREDRHVEAPGPQQLMQVVGLLLDEEQLEVGEALVDRPDNVRQEVGPQGGNCLLYTSRCV